MPGPSLRSTEWVTPAKARESTVVPVCGDPLASRLDYPVPWLPPQSSEGTDDASVRLTILEVVGPKHLVQKLLNVVKNMPI